MEFWFALAVGFVVAFVAMFFIRNATSASLPVVTGFLALLFAGAGVTFAAQQLKITNAADWGGYVFGLVAGIVFFTIFYRTTNGEHAPVLKSLAPSLFNW